MALLEQNMSSGAFHNSEERYESPKCLPETRLAILAYIMGYVRNTLQVLRVFFWLYGPVGVGKSAIAQTIAEMCEEEGLLAAAFFFSRLSDGRSNSKHLVATIVYQLITTIPEIKHLVCAAIERDPMIFSKQLEAQMVSLVIGPLNTTFGGEENRERMPKRPALIIIDGLDECIGGEVAHKRVLALLSLIIHRSSFPLRVFVSCRPEPWIKASFDSLQHTPISIQLEEHHPSNDDIDTFLRSKFNAIKDTHPLGNYLSAIGWPSPPDFDHLRRKSHGLFLYAATAMRYVEFPRGRPDKRLDDILRLSATPPDDPNPFSELHLIYREILSNVNIADIKKVQEVIVLVRLDMYPSVSLSEVEFILDYRPGDLQIIMRDMHALMHIPPDSHKTLKIYHGSFLEFLFDRKSAGEFFVDLPSARSNIAWHWLQPSKHWPSGMPPQTYYYAMPMTSLYVTTN